jgi:hypothetical protein
MFLFPERYVIVAGGRDVSSFYLTEQHGLLRLLSAAELSDGTLRYLLWIAALLTPRPRALMVLSEPETSLHPDLPNLLAPLGIGREQRRIDRVGLGEGLAYIVANAGTGRRVGPPRAAAGPTVS